MGRGAFLPVLPASIIGRQTINLEMKSEELETSGISRTRWVRVLCVWPGFRVPGGKPAGGAAQEALGPGPCRREHLWVSVLSAPQPGPSRQGTSNDSSAPRSSQSRPGRGNRAVRPGLGGRGEDRSCMRVVTLPGAALPAGLLGSGCS